MCLHYDGIKKAPRKTGFGYKVFEQDKAGRLFGIRMNMGVERLPGEWLPSANYDYITTTAEAPKPLLREITIGRDGLAPVYYTAHPDGLYRVADPQPVLISRKPAVE